LASGFVIFVRNATLHRKKWLQRIITYFNIIWDEAEELQNLAAVSHPRVVIDTSGLSPQATELANLLARNIRIIDRETIKHLTEEIEAARKRRRGLKPLERF
jgi:4-hydroxy-3-methylbut-2-enyl diphosphate reductase IspH